jgi:peptidylprolyl isomerase
VRKSLALILSAGVLLSLAACSGSPASADCSAATAPGDSSEVITATGDFGSDPHASFPFPLVTDSTERSVLIEGEGAPAPADGSVLITFSTYDPTTGAAGQQGQTFVSLSGVYPTEFTDAFVCSTPGTRLAIVVPPDVAANTFNSPNSVVMVADVNKTFPGRATGVNQPVESGFPGVVLDSTGRPGITIGAGVAPTEAKSELLKKGDGAVVGEGDIVIVNATGVSYASPKAVANTSWGKGPQIWTMSDSVQPSQSSWQPAGITPFLVGQTVGSQVLVLLPDASGGSATAYVVDILGAVPQPAQ